MKSILSCDVCFRIGNSDEFSPMGELTYFHICQKFGSEYIDKLLDTDTRYICMDCIHTLQNMNDANYYHIIHHSKKSNK